MLAMPSFASARRRETPASVSSGVRGCSAIYALCGSPVWALADARAWTGIFQIQHLKDARYALNRKDIFRFETDKTAPYRGDFPAFFVF
jgi:hypothetical protein